jgi:hypothetical protein
MGKTSTLALRIPEEDYAILQTMADGMGQSMASIVRDMVHSATEMVRLTIGDIKDKPSAWQTRLIKRTLLTMSSALDDLEGGEKI